MCFVLSDSQSVSEVTVDVLKARAPYMYRKCINWNQVDIMMMIIKNTKVTTSNGWSSGFFCLFALFLKLLLSQEINIPELYLPESKFLMIALLRLCRVSLIIALERESKKKKNVNRKEVECFELNAQY